ncbi:MAG: ABC transporter ATP-binding protein [Micromonosporaceae bacterium]
MTEIAVRARELRKQYGHNVAVDNIDLEITHGEIFALLGPNGAGKTTTIEMLEGHRTRDSGELSVLGTDPGRAGRSWWDRIGIVTDVTRDSTELTVREAVRHFAGYYSRPRDPDEVIGRVGLDEKADAKVSQLSRGQRRRLDVALGIVGRPALLFLDEPTTGFDPESRQQFWRLIKELAGEGTTILLTTHYLPEAEALADRVAIIASGKIFAQGTPATLDRRNSGAATVSWDEAGERRSVETMAASQMVVELVDRFGGEVPGLTVARPTLEETYLHLIGGVKE